MNNLETNTKDLKVAMKEFKRLRKSNLVEIIVELQELVLGYKARIVELERMLDERGLVIEELREGKRRCKNCEYGNKAKKNVETRIIQVPEKTDYLNLLCKKLWMKICKEK